MFYNRDQSELEALPPLPSYEDKSIPDIVEDNLESLGRLLDNAAAGPFMKAYFRLSDAWLKWKYERQEKNGNAPSFLPDLKKIEARLNKPGIYTLNDAYDFFCTSGIKIVDGKPVVTSTLDWGKQPGIAQRLYHAEFEGEGGRYDSYNIFGYSGLFRAHAKNRMAVALNRAPVPTIFGHKALQKTRLEHWLDNKAAQNSRAGFLYKALAFTGSVLRGEYPAMLVSSVAAYASPHTSMPVLLKDIFDSAAGFDEAVQTLAQTPLSAPAVLVLAGVDASENCAIYRTRNNCVIETTPAGYEKISALFNQAGNVTVMQTDEVCIANHWPEDVTEILGPAFDRVDLPRTRCANMTAQLKDRNRNTVDIKRGIEVDSTVLFSESTPATGEIQAVAIDHYKPIAYHHKAEDPAI